MGPDETQEMFEKLLKKLQGKMPKERSEYARRIAVTITDLEKVYAYYNDFVLNNRSV